MLQRPEHSLGGPERHLVAADHVVQADTLARCGGPPRQLQEFLGLVETHRNCPQPELRYSSGASVFVTHLPVVSDPRIKSWGAYFLYQGRLKLL